MSTDRAPGSLSAEFPVAANRYAFVKTANDGTIAKAPSKAPSKHIVEAASEEEAWEKARQAFGSCPSCYGVCYLYRLYLFPPVRHVSGDVVWKADKADPRGQWIRVVVGYANYDYKGQRSPLGAVWEEEYPDKEAQCASFEMNQDQSDLYVGQEYRGYDWDYGGSHGNTGE